jgi:glycosyltransferase involved in cell wall biosynthesis
MFQYFPAMEKQGISLQTEPLFQDDYIDRLYSGRSRLGSVIKSYMKRVFTILSMPKCDAIWVEKELFPWTPWFVEKIFFKILGKKYIVDYDDAIFHQYDQHRFGLVRAILGQKCDQVMRHSSVMVAGNEYLAARARSAGAEKIVIIPTVVSGEKYQTSSGRHEPLVIGWIGSSSTVGYLNRLRPILSDLAKRHSFVFRIVGAAVDWKDVPVVNVPWDESQEVAFVQSFDIGIMPLKDSLWEKGKCGFKLIQYMACGKPVVADPIGVNSCIVHTGINGYLPETQQQWTESLEELLLNSELREKMGHQGRDRFEKEYSLEVWSAPLMELFFQIQKVDR